MEKSTPIGIGAGLVLIYGAIFLGDGWHMFFDVNALIIVLGGTTAAILVGFSLDELQDIIPGVKRFFNYQAPDLRAYVEEFSELSRTARRDGLLALDRRIDEVDDALMASGLEMAVDGLDLDEMEELMDQQIKAELKPHQQLYKFFSNAGNFAPAFGMIGTLIGLIQMLQNLEDPSAIGPAMAVAMITTFYGVLLANLLFLPIAVKLKSQMQELLQSRMLVRTGIMGIVQGDAPSMIEKRLILFLKDADNEGGSASETPLSRAA